MADRFCKMSRHGAIEGKAVTTRAAQKQSGDGEGEKVMEGGGAVLYLWWGLRWVRDCHLLVSPPRGFVRRGSDSSWEVAQQKLIGRRVSTH